MSTKTATPNPKLRTQAEVEAKLAELKATYDKYGRKPANLSINAPRALMQVHYEAVENTLMWALGLKDK